MTDKQFLNWVADRFVFVYGESQNVDYVRKLRAMADAAPGMVPKNEAAPGVVWCTTARAALPVTAKSTGLKAAAVAYNHISVIVVVLLVWGALSI